MVTIAEVVAQPDLHLSTVVLPAPDRAVRWVATSELVDPAPFLEGFEVLLTTGLEAKDWSEEWDDYVRRLVDVPIAALGIGTGLSHAVPPSGLIRACERHGLNLVEVPREIPFVAVSRRTAQLLEEEAIEATRVALDLQRRLAEAATRPRAARSIVETLGRLLGGAACTLSVDGHLLDGPFGPELGSLPTHEIAEEISRIRLQGLRAAASIAAGDARTVAIHPLGLSGRPTSYLAALIPGRPTDGQRGAVATAVSLLGLVAEQERSSAEARRLLHDRAVQLLVADQPTTAQVLLDVQPETTRLPEQIRLLRVAGTAERLADARAYLDQEGIVCGGDGELCVVAAAAAAPGLAHALAARELLVGVGELVALANASVSHNTAGRALAQATRPVPVVTWERIVNDGALALIDPERAAAFAASFLAGLSDVDLETLRSFLRHHGSRLKVAEELGVHRNTVRNRIDAIESALGGSLDDPQLRVNAWIALQALTGLLPDLGPRPLPDATAGPSPA
jgi:purine catabolism regulator